MHEPERLLAEIAAAVQSDADADVLAEAAEILVAERGRVRLGDRWRPGTKVRIATILGESITGRVRAVGAQIVLIDGIDGASHAIASDGIARVEGLGSVLRPEETPQPRVQVTWAWWLRRSEVALLQCRDAWREIVRVTAVGIDHLDGWSQDGTRQTIPFSALVLATDRGSRQSSPRP